MKKIVFLFMLSAIIQYSTAQNEVEPNYDESKVPVYELSNPLMTVGGIC